MLSYVFNMFSMSFQHCLVREGNQLETKWNKSIRSKPLKQLLPQCVCWSANRTNTLKASCHMEPLLKDFGGFLHGNSCVLEGGRRLDGILEVPQVCLVGRVDASTDRGRCRVAQLLLAEVLLANVLHGFRWIEGNIFWVENRPQNHVYCVPGEIAHGEGMHIELRHLGAKLPLGFHDVKQDEEISWRRIAGKWQQAMYYQYGVQWNHPSPYIHYSAFHKQFSRWCNGISYTVHVSFPKRSQMY